MSLSKTMCEFNDLQEITKELQYYQTIWESDQFSFPATQTEFFRSAIPLEPVDFTETAQTYQLQDIFSSGKVVYPMLGPYNCHMLWRQTQEMPHVIIYNSDNFVVLHPLGEPGLALGNHGSRVSHLMVLPKSQVGPITVNEMLPSTDAELHDLSCRMSCLNIAYSRMNGNAALKFCGSMVIERAEGMGVSVDTPIRDFMALQIASFTPEFCQARPGYKLLSENGIDYAEGGFVVMKSIIDTVFGDDDLTLTKCIQGPNDCSQLVSHIHGFLLPQDEIPKGLQTSYICAETLFRAKSQLRAH
jgi:hypothetical protein